MTKKIFITGSTGFVGTNCLNFFKKDFSFTLYNKNENKVITNEDVVLHFAGKAHDLKNAFNVKEYYEVNTDLTKNIFSNFLKSNAKVFIFLSSVKAVKDNDIQNLTEEIIPNPNTHYGKSKLLAEQYILSEDYTEKRVYILRPCMIHGPNNKGNLNVLYNYIIKGMPWVLGNYENRRSFCSIDNLCLILNELINNELIPSGIYNIADDVPLSTNDVIKLIAKTKGIKSNIWFINKTLIKSIAVFGNILNLPFNTDKLNKLTDNYVVNTSKIKKYLNKTILLTSREGFIKTFQSFN